MSAASSSCVEAQVALSPEVAVQAEFEALYRRYFGFAWASLRRLGVPNAAIDDAAQDLWVTVHRRLDSYDPDASMKAWIFGIARRVASHYRRSAQRNARKIAALSIGDQRRSDQPIGRRDIALTMETFLGRLDETKRIAFVLSELEGWSAPEIARVVGTNANTIYSRIRLAKQQLRDHFAAADAEAYVEQAIEEAKASSRPPRGAAKHCWVALAPKLGTGGVSTAATGLGAALAKLKFAALGAVAGAVGLIGVDAALPETPPIEPRAATPAVRTEARDTPAKERAPDPAPTIAAATAVVPTQTEAAPEVPVQRPATKPAGGGKRSIGATTSQAESPPPAATEDGTPMLTQAKLALKRGDAARTLELVREHARRFPASRMSDMRAVIEVDALCASGRRDAARARAEEIRTRHPGSSAAKRVEHACKN